MKPFLCSECIDQTSQIIKNIKEAITHAQMMINEMPRSTITKKQQIIIDSNNSDDENILNTNRCIQASQKIQSLNDTSRKANLDLRVNKAYDYFSGSNFKTNKMNSTDFICDETEPSYECNKENVRVSTITEEINKPQENIFNNSTNIEKLSESNSHLQYFQVTLEDELLNGENEQTKMHIIDFRSIDKSIRPQNNKVSQKLLRNISSERPVSYRYDNKRNLSRQKAAALSCYLDEESTDSMRISDCSNQINIRETHRLRNNLTPLLCNIKDTSYNLQNYSEVKNLTSRQ